MASRTDRLRPLRWTAWLLSGALLFFWTPFFVEHLAWFLSPDAGFPPPKVWLLQLCHLGLLAGYGLSFRWPRAASVAIVVFSLAFFPFVAGSNAIVFTGASVFPAVLLTAHWLANRRPAGVSATP